MTELVSGALGVVFVVGWLLIVVLVLGLVARAVRRRALRRGTHPLRLLPWYLGGPQKVDIDLPDDKRSARDRRRHP